MCCDDGGGSAPAPQENEFSRTLASIMKQQNERAVKTYQPLEDKLIAMQGKFGTADYIKEQENAATADVTNAFAKTNAAAEANADSLGINPSDPRAIAMRRGLGIAQAGATAGAATMARKGAEGQDFNTLAGLAGKGDAKVDAAIRAAGTGGSQYNDAQRNEMAFQQQQGQGAAGIGSLVGTVGGAAMMFF